MTPTDTNASKRIAHDAVAGAGGDRKTAQAAIASQPFPYITDMFEGFAIHLTPASRDDERVLRIRFREGLADATLYDTALAGTTFRDAAAVDAVNAAAWPEVERFMAAAGVAMRATLGGAAARIDILGDGLAIRPGAAKATVPAASLTFASRRSWLVEATLSPTGQRLAGLDWILVERKLEAAGITLEAVAAEPKRRKPRAARSGAAMHP